MLQLYHQNPRFGLFLVRLIVRQLVDNWKDADERARAATTQGQDLLIDAT